MISTPNNAMITAKAKTILDYLNQNGHRFDLNGHFDHRPEGRDAYVPISDETDESSTNDAYPGALFGGQAKPKDPIQTLEKIRREIRAWEETYRKSEREGNKYDLEKCVEIHGREMSACRRRWKDDPILSLLFPKAYDECMTRAHERYRHCASQHKMPAENPEYGPADAGAPADPDREKREGNEGQKFTELFNSSDGHDEKTGREEDGDPYSFAPSYGTPPVFRAPLPPELQRSAGWSNMEVSPELMMQLLLALLARRRPKGFGARTGPSPAGIPAPARP